MDLERAKKMAVEMRGGKSSMADDAYRQKRGPAYVMEQLIAEVERLEKLANCMDRTATGTFLRARLGEATAETSRAYNRLGELARLADLVCTWVTGPAVVAIVPGAVMDAALELMEYVDEVRP